MEDMRDEKKAESLGGPTSYNVQHFMTPVATPALDEVFVSEACIIAPMCGTASK